ncbi:farnesyl cysteine-carboxyl methyltransferase [Dimargaris verticillata]|uniref:Protein-S-isoprenylcysteine O-methyltransferase n=1 Tax=Dimargaris verticillata TaxID=2761393 RepID=A0A9W8E842_9FUNG|nr:farnesyl cysteine-carboxyl methyltransferase [Dimargaris verticillata]
MTDSTSRPTFTVRRRPFPFDDSPPIDGAVRHDQWGEWDTPARNDRDRWFDPLVPLGGDHHSPPNVALTSFILGAVGGLGTGWLLWWVYQVWWLPAATPFTTTTTDSTWPDAMAPFGLVLVFVPLYHILEYMSTALYNPVHLEYGSFMLSPDPNGRFAQALVVSAVEFLIEAYFWPSLKTQLGLRILGMNRSFVFRTLAMVTAKMSFNHYVARFKTREHTLITHGVYRLVRHPAYFGFFIWAVGLQLVLANPLSLVAYIGVLGYFFYDRIQYEEQGLVRFFGADYVAYRQRTSRLIPYLY